MIVYNPNFYSLAWILLGFFQGNRNLSLYISSKEETADLVTFTEEILNGKLHFLRSDSFEKDFTDKSAVMQYNVTLSLTNYMKVTASFFEFLSRLKHENYSIDHNQLWHVI